MPAHRIAEAVSWATPCQRPASIPQSRPRGAKAAGLRYERALAKALPAAAHGQWFEYRDRTGRHFCQPDLLLDLGSHLVVLEVKYTWTLVGHLQFSQLYRPVLAAALPGKRVVGLQVCKVVLPETPADTICSRLDDAIIRSMSGGRSVLHWLGQSPEPLAVARRVAHLDLAPVGA